MQRNLDTLARRYGCRPSDLFNSNKFDFQIDFICAITGANAETEEYESNGQKSQTKEQFKLPDPERVQKTEVVKTTKGEVVNIGGFDFPLSDKMKSLI